MTANEIANLLKRAGVTIEKQARAPGAERDLYRIRFSDGSLSDLGNLPRITDAAITHAHRLTQED